MKGVKRRRIIGRENMKESEIELRVRKSENAGKEREKVRNCSRITRG